MTRPKFLWPILAASCCVLVALVLGFLWGRSGGKTPESGEAESKVSVVAIVKAVPIQKGRLEGRISTFGSIVPIPGAAQSISVPYECRVLSLGVSEGQPVVAGAPLLSVVDSPDALLALDQARIDARSADIQLQQVRSRHALKLADNAQLAQAQQSYDSTQTRLKSLEARQMGAPHVLRAMAHGVAVKVFAQVGAVVPAGSPLLELVDTARLEARLGVEPQDTARVSPGGSVDLTVVETVDKTKVQARIRTVSPAINPTTRLRDVYVSLPSGHPFVFGQFVRGSLLAVAREGFIVAYASVLPEDGKQVIYTIRKDHAVRHEIQILLQSGDQLQVSAQDLEVGELVVTQGNYELQDGMAVRVEGSTR